MIEVPAAALIAEQLAREVDFFSIGTNDLTQYTLAMDRGHPKLAKQADALHPAVLRLIGMTVEGAHMHGKWVGVCGGIASDAMAVPVLVGLGVDELSVSIPAVGSVGASTQSWAPETYRSPSLRRKGLPTRSPWMGLLGGAAPISSSTLKHSGSGRRSSPCHRRAKPFRSGSRSPSRSQPQAHRGSCTSGIAMTPISWQPPTIPTPSLSSRRLMPEVTLWSSVPGGTIRSAAAVLTVLVDIVARPAIGLAAVTGGNFTLAVSGAPGQSVSHRVSTARLEQTDPWEPAFGGSLATPP